MLNNEFLLFTCKGRRRHNQERAEIKNMQKRITRTPYFELSGRSLRLGRGLWRGLRLRRGLRRVRIARWRKATSHQRCLDFL